MPYYLRKCLKLYVSQTRKLSRNLLLTVNVSSQGLVSILNSIVPLQDPLQCLKSLFRVHSGRFLSYPKKRKISQNDHLLSLVVIRCHSLSFVVTRCHSFSLIVSRCTTCCHWLYHSLSFVVTRFHSLSIVVPLVVTRFHSLLLDVSLVCLFINDLKEIPTVSEDLLRIAWKCVEIALII